MGDKASQAVGTAKDAAGTTEELVVDSAHTIYNKAYDAAAATGDKAGSAVRRVSSFSCLFATVQGSFYAMFRIMVNAWWLEV